MAKLSAEVKAFIVMSLARFEAPGDVRKAVNREYGLEVSSSQVAYYNPAAPTGNDRLAERWKELYREAREAFTSRVEDVAIAHERVRLERLQEVVEERMRAKDHRTAMKALEQAAKERGKAFTNVRDIQSRGKEIEPPNIYVYGGEESAPEEGGEG